MIFRLAALGFGAFLLACVPVCARAAPRPVPAIQDVIVDADAGDDIDDAFAIALVLHSPELHVLGITTAFGDTALRARLVSLILQQAGRSDIPVAAGPVTLPRAPFTQARLAQRGPVRQWPDAVAFTLDQLRSHPPGSITLLALAPATNIGAMMARDPVAFRRLARVVMMGGAVRTGYGGGKVGPEYNFASAPDETRRLLASGVPLSLLPVDSTEIPLGELARDRIFASGSGLTDMLALATAQWAVKNHWGTTPVLFDVVPVAVLIDPSLCPMQPIRLTVGAGGMVHEGSGARVSVCLVARKRRILSLLASRLEQAGRLDQPSENP